MTPLPLSPEYYPFIISQQHWKMNTGLQRPIVLQQTGSWWALFNEGNYMTTSTHLTAADSTTSPLTCEPPTLSDAHYMSEDERCLWEEPDGLGGAEESVRESRSLLMGVCKSWRTG